MTKKIRMGKRLIGEGEPIFIIAEAGVNHNGSPGLARQLIDVARKAGADAVKFQTFKAEEVIIENAPMAKYQRKNIGNDKSQQQMIRELELDYGEFTKLKRYCDKKGILFLSTPHSEDAIDFLESLVPAYKIGSGDLTNFPFLEKVAQKKKPMILGTGMSTLSEIIDAIGVIHKQENEELIALHCTTNYPCPPEEVNLRAMTTLMEKLDCVVGYSDHTLGITIPIMAATLGARVIEKHFTLDKSLPGPDHKASLNPEELKEMVKVVREVEIIMGSPKKKATKSEREMMKLIRKCLVAAKDIQKGTTITREMLTIKRPGIGIEPKHMEKIVGHIANRDIKKDEILNWNNLAT